MFHTQSDVVFVKGLKVEAVIGVFDWERAITQPLLIDIALETDISRAAVSDDVSDALSYKEVCDDVSVWCKEIQAKLLEHLAGQISDKLFAKYDCQKNHVKYCQADCYCSSRCGRGTNNTLCASANQ
ncbi:7,8-dihydroneopterin aldolase [Psychrobacter sp. KH172YL61]|uniref:dihydroneopterin aldolase n=1 Tax=Psychrobacter sp. KH172YL61 TaxID=2517899 RepID=UPI0010B83D54|nr:dihydroneopterin aldolase [Psychrobacter sp. KH172YL61]BBI68016.1 7,8-dihydroneopterin aldolase [Psychrobacter sp. KH172YL61]